MTELIALLTKRLIVKDTICGMLRMQCQCHFVRRVLFWAHEQLSVSTYGRDCINVTVSHVF